MRGDRSVHTVNVMSCLFCSYFCQCLLTSVVIAVWLIQVKCGPIVL